MRRFNENKKCYRPDQIINKGWLFCTNKMTGEIMGFCVSNINLECNIISSRAKPATEKEAELPSLLDVINVKIYNKEKKLFRLCQVI